MLLFDWSLSLQSLGEIMLQIWFLFVLYILEMDIYITKVFAVHNKYISVYIVINFSYFLFLKVQNFKLIKNAEKKSATI